MIAEYETNFTPAVPTTKYLTQDHLGSPRVITNQSGAIVSRHDYRAFGEEVYSGTGNRLNAQGYGQADGVRKKYTGYERDYESGLDFAQARYYNSKLGRFTSVDPLTASANVKDPQTLNRYSYAMNSPYKFTDSLGLVAWADPGACGQWCSNAADPAIGWTSNSGGSAGNEATSEAPVIRESSGTSSNVHDVLHASVMSSEDDPIPTTVSLELEYVGVEWGQPGSDNQDYVSGRAELKFSVLDQNGNPFEGTVREKVTTSDGSEVTTQTKPISLVDGMFFDIVDPGGNQVKRDATPQERRDAEEYVRGVGFRTEQVATFTITSNDGKHTLTVEHTRILGNSTKKNVGSKNVFPVNPNSGTNYRFWDRGIKTISSN